MRWLVSDAIDDRWQLVSGHTVLQIRWLVLDPNIKWQMTARRDRSHCWPNKMAGVRAYWWQRREWPVTMLSKWGNWCQILLMTGVTCDMSYCCPDEVVRSYWWQVIESDVTCHAIVPMGWHFRSKWLHVTVLGVTCHIVIHLGKVVSDPSHGRWQSGVTGHTVVQMRWLQVSDNRWQSWVWHVIMLSRWEKGCQILLMTGDRVRCDRSYCCPDEVTSGQW